MLRLLQLIFIGHIHKWETKEVRNLNGSFGGKGSRVLLRCEECGKWKKEDLI